MTRFALWLAEWSDRWARRVTGDDCADRLADADIECWEVDRGALRVTYLDEYLLARRRHPAGSKLAKG